MNKYRVPPINNRFICILHLDKLELGALISSYFSDDGTYVPFFLFPEIDRFLPEEDDSDRDGYISHIIGDKTSVLINNAIARMGGYENIIFVGLNKHQKQYLKKYLKMPILEIDSADDVHYKIRTIINPPSSVLKCRGDDILTSLYLAKKSNSRLEITDYAEQIVLPRVKDSGIIVVEKSKKHNATSLIAVNYAIAVGAGLEVVEGVEDDEIQAVTRFIRNWKSTGEKNQLQKIVNKVNSRVGHIDFSKHEYATFFTEGLPYSLVIKNCIPNTQIHLTLKPDLFVCNAIGFETGSRFSSAVVFSPLYFVDEETKEVIEGFKKANYYVRPLIGKNATVHNLDFHAQHFPYDLLHICSHGGEVDGYQVTEDFVDRKGVKHSVEYDEVVGFASTPGEDLIAVHRKVFFRKFDGFTWMSDELKRQKIPEYVFEDMRKSLFDSENKSKKNSRKPKKYIPTSCAITCVDSIHQGHFQVLASNTSPIIFNNTCWSWNEVAHFFLSEGARGYIGTLWAIGNQEAVKSSKLFYKELFNGSVMEALHIAQQSIQETAAADIFIYWGLHFTSLSTSMSPEEGRKRVFNMLLSSLLIWMDKVSNTKNENLKQNSLRIAHQIYKEISTNFNEEDLHKLEGDITKILKKGDIEIRTAETSKDDVPLNKQASIDYPTEFRKSDSI